MERQGTHILLDSRELDDTLVNGPLRDQAVDCHLTGLSETVSTIHSLSIVRRIPIVIVEDDCVRGGKIDTQTSSTSTQDEDEDVIPGLEVENTC